MVAADASVQANGPMQMLGQWMPRTQTLQVRCTVGQLEVGEGRLSHLCSQQHMHPVLRADHTRNPQHRRKCCRGKPEQLRDITQSLPHIQSHVVVQREAETTLPHEVDTLPVPQNQGNPDFATELLLVEIGDHGTQPKRARYQLGCHIALSHISALQPLLK